MGKVLVIKGADFSAVAVDGVKPTPAKTLLTNWKSGVYSGTVHSGVNGEISARANRVSTKENPPIKVSKYNSISIDLSMYNYLVVYRDSSQQLITGTRYGWEDSDTNFKNAFPMPGNAVYVDVSLKPLTGTISTDANVLNAWLVE